MEVEKAAVVIQAHFRGLQARKVYARKLLDMFENEEAMRREKERLQVWEGEVLIERYALQQSIDDDLTLSSNEQRRYNTMATRIQRAWKKYQHNQRHCVHALTHKNTFQHNSSVGQDSLTSISSAEDSASPKSNTSVDPSKPVQTSNGQASYDEFVNRDLTIYNRGRVSAIQKDASVQPASVEDLARRVNSQSFISETPLEDNFEDQTQNDATSNLSTQMNAMEFEYPESGIMPAHSEDKYRLLYTIDLSDSSQEDNQTDDPIGVGSPEPGNNEATVPSIDQTSTISSDTITSAVYPLTNDSHKQVVDTPMSFSEEFDIHFPAGVAAAISLAYNTPSAQPLTHAQVMRGRSKSLGSESSRGRTQLDHSKSPVYAMNNRELNLLLVSLERKLKSMSQSLVQLLQERESLKQENGLLHTNIAHLARRAQQLYT